MGNNTAEKQLNEKRHFEKGLYRGNGIVRMTIMRKTF